MGLETIEPACFGHAMCSIKCFKEAKIYSSTSHNKKTFWKNLRQLQEK